MAHKNIISVDKENYKSILNSANSTERVSTHTHPNYRYPARFSPLFIENIIENFTESGDLIVDPFMGGGTTAVEAHVKSRNYIGFDNNYLAYFVSKVKTKKLIDSELLILRLWSYDVIQQISNTKNVTNRAWQDKKSVYIESGYFMNMTKSNTWRVENYIDFILYNIEHNKKLNKSSIKEYARFIVLSVSQWALDNSKAIPSKEAFQKKFIESADLILNNARSYANTLGKNKKSTLIIKNQDSVNIAKNISVIKQLKSQKVKLILTSPPYPGIRVIYDHWQILGRKETRIPYWIANGLDGHSYEYYNLGRRTEKNLHTYYSRLHDTFREIKKICSEETIIVQVVGFKDIKSQMQRYLEVMEVCGFEEHFLSCDKNYSDKRIWREVPNRGWQAVSKGTIDASKELVLFHKIKK
jgi:DNA modification methylase